MIYIIVCVPDPRNQSVIERANSCSRDHSSVVRQFIHTVSIFILFSDVADKFKIYKSLYAKSLNLIILNFESKLWKPVFKKFDVKMPKQCPLHFSHDVFSIQELAKLHYRTNLWTCGICGKSFYREPYLDMHISSKHSDNLLLVICNFLISSIFVKKLFQIPVL